MSRKFIFPGDILTVVKGEKVVDPGETLLARRHGVANIHFVSPTQIARWHAEKEHA